MYPGEEKAQSDECVLEITIYFSFCPFFPTLIWKKKSMKWKVLWEGLKKKELPGQPKTLTLAFSPSLFLRVFGPTLRLSSMGTQPGPYWENQLFRPSTSWLELRGGPHIWNDVIPSALIPWLSSWHWQTAWGATFDPLSSWFNLTGMFQLLNLYLSK